MQLRLTKGLQIFLVSFQRNLSLGTRLIRYEAVLGGVGGCFFFIYLLPPYFREINF